MTEFRVWRSIVDWVEKNNGRVIAGCPPGSSVYDYAKFLVINPITGKRDEPDILFVFENAIHIIECKPTLSASKSHARKANSNESDIEKLLRLSSDFRRGLYHHQMKENYNIDLDSLPCRFGIGYASSSIHIPSMLSIEQFVVHESYEITLIRELSENMLL